MELLEHVGMLARSGQISEMSRCRMMEDFRAFLRGARGLGLTDPGSCMAGLPHDVILRLGDMAKRPSGDCEDEVGEAIPDAVVAQILAEFSKSPEADTRSTGVEHRSETVGDLCRLPLLGCLDYDSSHRRGDRRGNAGRRCWSTTCRRRTPPGCRLPLSEGDAQTHPRPASTRVRARYPETDDGANSAVPARRKQLPEAPNHIDCPRLGDGRSGCGHGASSCSKAFSSATSSWSPETSTANAIRYLSSRIHCYGFRHTYAQRHIDRGTEVAVLCALMGHTQARTRPRATTGSRRPRNAGRPTGCCRCRSRCRGRCASSPT